MPLDKVLDAIVERRRPIARSAISLKKLLDVVVQHRYYFGVGILLLSNPLAMLGFGVLGPTAGSIAAAWQSSIGAAVASGSPFAILQSCGMVWGATISTFGGAITAATTAVVAATTRRQKKPAKDLLES